jgi:hypothetical protein
MKQSISKTAYIGLYTTREVAEMLGVNRQRVIALANSRNVGTKIGRQMVFTQSDIIAMRIRVAGRPRQLSQMDKIDKLYAQREAYAREKYKDQPERLAKRLKILKIHKERAINGISDI